MAQNEFYKIERKDNEMTRKSGNFYWVFIYSDEMFPHWEYCAEYKTRKEAQVAMDGGSLLKAVVAL